MTIITIVELLIRAPEGRFVFQSMLGTVGFTVAFIAGAMYLIQDGLLRSQRFQAVLIYALAMIHRGSAGISNCTVYRLNLKSNHRGRTERRSQCALPVG